VDKCTRLTCGEKLLWSRSSFTAFYAFPLGSQVISSYFSGIFSLISILDPVGTPLKNGMPGFSGRLRGIL
jgi:hypothetical protein